MPDTERRLIQKRAALRKHYRKRKSDPERHRKYLDWCKDSQKRKRDQIKKDPLEYEKWKKKQREYMRSRRVRLKELDPEEYQKLLLRDRKAAAEKRKSPHAKKYMQAFNKEYVKKRRKVDPIFRLISSLRCRMYYALFGGAKKLDRSKTLIGCKNPELKRHLESHFKSGMSWDNYGFGKGKWVVDHIKPCAAFDLTVESEQRECFNFKNLQPLWYEENSSKGSLHEGFRVRKIKK